MKDPGDQVQPAIPSSDTFSHRATLSRLPCGSLRSALTGSRRNAAQSSQMKEWQVLIQAEHDFQAV